jgi:hypothetical protein
MMLIFVANDLESCCAGLPHIGQAWCENAETGELLLSLDWQNTVKNQSMGPTVKAASGHGALSSGLSCRQANGLFRSE